MSTAWLLVFHGKAVSKLRAVVGQYLGDSDGRSQLQTAQKVDAALVSHVAINVHEHPAGSAIDGHEEIAPRSLVGHLRQLLNVDMNEARLLVLECFLRRYRLAVGLGNDVLQPGHSFTSEQARKAGTRYIGIDVLPGDIQQVVKRQVQRLAQRQNDHFLGRAQRRVQCVCAV